MDFLKNLCYNIIKYRNRKENSNMGKPLHDDTPEEALIRHNTAVLLSIGMMLSKIAEGCGVNARRFQAFSRGERNLTDKEI